MKQFQTRNQKRSCGQRNPTRTIGRPKIKRNFGLNPGGGGVMTSGICISQFRNSEQLTLRKERTGRTVKVIDLTVSIQ